MSAKASTGEQLRFAVFHILPTTQRSEKVKWRKGRRASIVVVAFLSRRVRRRSVAMRH